MPPPDASVVSSSAIWERRSKSETTGGGDCEPSVMYTCARDDSDDRVVGDSASLAGSHARLRVSIE